ncbi:hypothetical protein FKW77_010454 [Venturia effusa]|uniref:Chitin-binding type-4 domain-containing protein n=1 Tax=Venturia effusa TaxID=50376 RepID=A0A517L4M0_9PEZI|nr:hypothetical protein FKW77_010454 [Venturia effusa]
MFTSSSSSSPCGYAVALLTLIAFSPLVSSHMEMSKPLPPRSQYNPALSGDGIDYNLKSPLDASGSNFPCHGYQNDPFVAAATYTAGQTYQMAISGSVTHGGGSCQLSLSYDNGGTFKVIKSMVGGCPLTTQYDFTIPSFAPTGNALFAWTWFNEVGNREMYMTCAFVKIIGSSATRRSRTKRQTSFTSMSSLPNIWRANIAGLNKCATAEGVDPVFSNLGPDVIYGGKSSSSSPKDTQDGCDSSTPSGQTFRASSNASTLSEGSPSPALEAATVATTFSSSPSSGNKPNATVATTSGAKDFAAVGGNSTEGNRNTTTSTSIPSILATLDSTATTTSTAKILAGVGENSTATSSTSVPLISTTSSPAVASTSGSEDLAEAGGNVTMISTSMPSMSATPIPTVARTSGAEDLAGVEGNSTSISTPTAPAVAASSTASASTLLDSTTAPAIVATAVTSSSTMLVSTTADSTAVARIATSASKSDLAPASPTILSATSDSSSFVPFADSSDSTQYLPCVPGAFLCTSPTTYMVCEQTKDKVPMAPSHEYTGPHSVTAGTQCVPFLAKFATPNDSAKFTNARGAMPAGHYRSDRYVGA